jgi:hypothetical protein
MERINSQVIPAEPLETWIEESEASRVLLAGKKSKHSGKIRGISSSQPGVINGDEEVRKHQSSRSPHYPHTKTPRKFRSQVRTVLEEDIVTDQRSIA